MLYNIIYVIYFIAGDSVSNLCLGHCIDPLSKQTSIILDVNEMDNSTIQETEDTIHIETSLPGTPSLTDGSSYSSISSSRILLTQGNMSSNTDSNASSNSTNSDIH